MLCCDMVKTQAETVCLIILLIFLCNFNARHTEMKILIPYTLMLNFFELMTTLPLYLRVSTDPTHILV